MVDSVEQAVSRLFEIHVCTLVDKGWIVNYTAYRSFGASAFSKKLENLQAAVALHFAHYNLVRLHKTLRITPAMAAGVTNRVWSLEELVE
jgi:hypothetical protein